jgi:hypothetical protein
LWFDKYYKSKTVATSGTIIVEAPERKSAPIIPRLKTTKLSIQPQTQGIATSTISAANLLSAVRTKDNTYTQHITRATNPLFCQKSESFIKAPIVQKKDITILNSSLAIIKKRL